VENGSSRFVKDCGASLEGRPPSTRWCSTACRNRYRVRYRGKAEAVGLFDLAGQLAAAVPQGVRLSVEVEGVTITACRADAMMPK
jgi:hypothetical protein